MADSEYAPLFAPFFSFAGIASAMVFGAGGAAYGTAKSGIGIAGVGTFRPDLIMKVGLPRWRGIGCMKASRTSSARCMEMLMWLLLQSLIPVVMSGIIAVYGLVISVLIVGDIRPDQQQSLYKGAMHLAAGLSVGLSGLAAGYTIGIVGDAGVRAYMQQSRVYVGMILILIFGEVLGLYGLIVGLILNSKS
ncbi:V-type proton ATPase 16 kDa proteolipid subunit 2 [Penicillium oxalicum]|uniref:V-type proton ATPase 16 kDa proteolipid subunit 2 n=1 Tax=Penicillium oxalicum TaxID=69781 RepID=UPI0020B890C8|nr:V-type proton ATPase 16 kDa proteolipid subunit 2 [Penicillium oxalicum]KAI2793601.1 V-type proton ATPase 16 kDa proteolipid subunit 2 [Penicillium oxalicum]